ncbi:MAG TPA: DUF1573 domain-containing protein [Pedobacter sp.]|jgi:hypothetical protein
MKKTFLLLFTASAILVSCNNTDKATTQSGSDTASAVSPTSAVESNKNVSIAFKSNNYDFGKITDGEKVTHDFEFTNTGTAPLIISNATAACGCTVPEYPKEPVAPGQSGIIKVVFNSAGKTGMQHKVVTLTTNANPPLTEIYITGEVKAK